MESIKLKRVDKIKFAFDSKYLLKYFSYMPDATAKRHCSSHSQNLAEKRPQELHWSWLVLSVIAAVP